MGTGPGPGWCSWVHLFSKGPKDCADREWKHLMLSGVRRGGRGTRQADAASWWHVLYLTVNSLFYCLVYSLKIITIMATAFRAHVNAKLWSPICRVLGGTGLREILVAAFGDQESLGRCISLHYAESWNKTRVKLKETLTNCSPYSGENRCFDSSWVKLAEGSELGWAVACHSSWFADTQASESPAYSVWVWVQALGSFRSHHLTTEELWWSRALSPWANLSDHYIGIVLSGRFLPPSHLSVAFVN